VRVEKIKAMLAARASRRAGAERMRARPVLGRINGGKPVSGYRQEEG